MSFKRDITMAHLSTLLGILAGFGLTEFKHTLGWEFAIVAIFATPLSLICGHIKL